MAVTAYGQIRLNSWNKPFFDAMSSRDLRDFLFQLGVFFVIAGFLLVLNVLQRWLVETLELKLREGLVHSLLTDWMRPRRAFWLANAGTIGVNPDQRMHEDARHLTELSADLGIGLLQASILFATFAGVLWGLSSEFSFRFGDRDYAVPGFMLWAAILYASAGSLMSFWVGRGLVSRNAERYAREADLRFSLVRVNEHVDAISLAQGEADEKRRIELNFRNVLAATRRIVWGHTNLTWVTAGFGWVTIVAPILVAAPLYFMGKISFGGLMMAAGAFTQAQSSLRWFIDNFSAIADWRATLLRVASFRHALLGIGEPHGFESRISYREGAAGAITIEDLQIVSSANADRLRERRVIVTAGERALILGAPGTGKTQLFRALAGLWPWGGGQITPPARGADLLSAARHPVSAARHAARSARLPSQGGELRPSRLRARALPARRRAARAAARRDAPLGPGAEPGRAALPGVRAHPFAEPAVGADRRHLRHARRRCARAGHGCVHQGARSRRASFTSAGPARRMRCSRRCCIWSRRRATQLTAPTSKEPGR